MITRNRAWRRRQERFVDRREKETQQRVSENILDFGARRLDELKPHRPGALTHHQDHKLQEAMRIDPDVISGDVDAA